MTFEYRPEVLAEMSKDDLRTWGHQMALFRRAHSLLQGDLGAVLGVNYSTVGAWELGRHSPRPCVCHLIALLFRYRLWQKETDRLRSIGAFLSPYSVKPKEKPNPLHAQQLKAFRRAIGATGSEIASILGISSDSYRQLEHKRLISPFIRRYVEVLSVYGLWESELARVRGAKEDRTLTFDF